MPDLTIDEVQGQGHHYRRGEYEYWTSGQPMDSATFVDYFLRNFKEGYDTENSLDAFWWKQVPDFVRRRHISTYTDRLQEPETMHKTEQQQLEKHPWRSVRQHADQIASGHWPNALFESFLARL